MGAICGVYEYSGRERQQVTREATRATEPTDRRKVVRIGDNGICLRRHSTILLPLAKGTESEQKGDRITTSGMELVKGDHAGTTPQTPDTVYSPTLLISTRSPKSRGSSIVCGMSSISIRRTVTFDKCVTIFRFYDWAPEICRAARKGPWMQLAVDRHRFKRRIQMTEVVLGNIFTDNHRDKMFAYTNKLI